MASPGPLSLTRVALRGFAAAAEALYPENDLGAPDWRDTEMVARAERWFVALPPKPRALLLALFSGLELGTPLLGRRWRAFSRLPVLERTALVRRWRASSIAPLKLLGDSIKSATSMIYLSHPAALRHVGQLKACDHVAPDLGVPVDPAALSSEETS